MISGATHLVGLIGWPARYSLSPVMQNAAFKDLDLDWEYLPLPVPPGSEASAIRGLAALGFVGANVTVPHKTSVMEHLDSLTDEVKAIGATNTLVIQETDEGIRKVHGHNTDWKGFVDSLRRNGFSIAGARAVVCGAGGVARAVVFGLLSAGASEITVLARQVRQAQRIASDLHSDGQGTILPLSLEPETLVESVRKATLLVNATPVGMESHLDESIWPHGVAIPSEVTVYDLVYAPADTLLLRQAYRAGAIAVGGIEMLIAQGAASFELWTGEQAPEPVMRRACMRAIEGEST